MYIRGRAGVLGVALAGALLIGIACSNVDRDTPSPTPGEATTESPAISGSRSDATRPEPQQQLTTQELVRIAEPAIVRIEAGGAVGTGFVIDSAGYIVTNHHVVESAILQPRTNILVTLYDGEELTAELVGADDRSDLALLRIPKDGLSALPLADPDSVAVGDDVVAIGFPLDLPRGEGGSFTVTRGIVSAKNRVISGGILGAIQTDAAINSGNSGGPLLNMSGEVVGVNTAIAFNQNVGVPASGIGFAVGADTIGAVYEELREDGRVQRAFLGIAAFEAVRPAKARELRMPEDIGGIYIGEVVPSGPVASAGLQAGDVIVKIDRFEIGNETDLAVALIVLDPGDTVPVEVYRSGQRMTFEVTLADAAGQ
ncbi:MAG: trypsin-like peptidase domain-containing protein [Dehalococcoidia bacterium]